MFYFSFRVISYNILAKCFTDSNKAADDRPACDEAYLKSSYRRLLLMHEIKSTHTKKLKPK